MHTNTCSCHLLASGALATPPKHNECTHMQTVWYETVGEFPFLSCLKWECCHNSCIHTTVGMYRHSVATHTGCSHTILSPKAKALPVTITYQNYTFFSWQCSYRAKDINRMYMIYGHPPSCQCIGMRSCTIKSHTQPMWTSQWVTVWWMKSNFMALFPNKW